MPIFLGNQSVGAAALGNLPVSEIVQITFDNDVAAFIAATGITGSAAIAVNTLVQSLKAEDLWNTFDCIYPMVGANANAHKYNLKNPQDTDAAYRLNFVGTWTHNSDGAKPNGVSGTYADTYYNLLTNLTTANGSLSYYSFTNNAAAFMAEIGAYDTGGPGGAQQDSFIRVFYVTGGSGRAYYSWGGGDPNVIISDSIGYYILNAQTSTTVDGWKDGIEIRNNGTTQNNGLPNRTAYLGAYNGIIADESNSDRGCSFATIGDTIASGKELTLSTIVNTFQSNLGRYAY
jgi:hypothetical protein